MSTPAPVIDSHIHLFPKSHLHTFAWYDPKTSRLLQAQHSITEYRAAVSSSTNPNSLRGFVFIETDRISGLEEKEWTHALAEVSFLTRIALGEPIPGEGHDRGDRDLCLGIVPWAPVPAGTEMLSRYMRLVKERTRTEGVWRRVRGVRYLLQDKPAGTILKDGFVDGLKWLGREGLVFDLGVDARSGGLGQLREVVELMGRLDVDDDKYEERVTIVINHLCKPNLRLPFSSSESVTTHPEFLEWESLITAMARYHKAYMKLSGGFSELPHLSSTTEPDISTLVDTLSPWTDVVFDTFGPERVMFGSDWPVCNIGGGGNEVAWRRWRDVVEGVLERKGLTDEQKKGIWGGVAAQAYGIEI